MGKKYADYKDEISADDLYKGLLAFELFSNKIPPVFSSTSFFDYCVKNHPTFSNSDHDYVRYKTLRNINVPRQLGIPVPMAYEKMCSVLKSNWSDNRSRTYSSTYPTDQKTHQAIYPSINNPSIDQVNVKQLRTRIEIKLEYDILCENRKYDKEQIDEIVDLIVETLCSQRKIMMIAGDELPMELVKERFERLEYQHIDYVMDSIRKTTTEVRNIKRYLLTALFNAPATISSYYTADFQHGYYFQCTTKAKIMGSALFIYFTSMRVT